jgi:hypothetical protein
MKKIILILTIGVTLISCDRGNTYQAGSKDFDTIMFEGCEYLYTSRGAYGHMMAHKGNCKNTIHNVRN